MSVGINNLSNFISNIDGNVSIETVSTKEILSLTDKSVSAIKSFLSGLDVGRNFVLKFHGGSHAFVKTGTSTYQFEDSFIRSMKHSVSKPKTKASKHAPKPKYQSTVVPKRITLNPELKTVDSVIAACSVEVEEDKVTVYGGDSGFPNKVIVVDIVDGKITNFLEDLLFFHLLNMQTRTIYEIGLDKFKDLALQEWKAQYANKEANPD